jgi:hypothetical protein
MIYLKSFLVGVAMFILGFALVLALMLRQAALPAPAMAANAEVGFDLRSVDTPAWPALLAGIAGFGGGFYWALKRSRRRAARH